ncbi:MAG: molybdate ABC transporter substrate-binding protein [Candidatus Eremiobacteraeota bacterium]|nr:molybdate ABC transporter substrate-binding protein [Candidatus Eremiobacteraeota bacterium]
MQAFILLAQSVLVVFAAASLNGAFPEIGKQFEAQHPGVNVNFSFNGSQILESQLAQGGKADVFASADQRWMDKATADGLVNTAASFASNGLVIAVSNTSKVQTASDLATPGTSFVVCADAVPCGRYTRIILQKMDSDPKYGPSYSKAVQKNIVSEELDVESVLTKIKLGAADAGVVYRSDVVGSAQKLRVVEFPSNDQPTVVYPIAVCKESASPDLAAAFVAYVRSSDGQAILKRFGFTPAP